VVFDIGESSPQSRRTSSRSKDLRAMLIGRPALLRALAAALALGTERRAFAGERSTAQSVGIDRGSLLADPRDLGAANGIVWGGRDRCDPTDPTCTAGGVRSSLEVQPEPPTPDGLQATDRILLSFSIAGESAGDVIFSLWGSAAPTAVATLVRLSKGTMANDRTEDPAGLERSFALRVVRDKAIVLGGLRQRGGSTILMAGKTRPVRVPVAPPSWKDTNGLSNDAAGVLSMRKGGESFEFTITPRANPALDKEWLVVGKVESGMDVLERINILPTNNYDRSPLAAVAVQAATVL